jgi:uncharacterized protein (TIGR00303 family)
MYDGLTIYGSNKFLSKVAEKKSLFLCTIATTATSRIVGITGAGISPELTEYTPAADVELIVRGEPVCLPEIPQTVIGGVSAPTPAVITKAALELADIPFLVVDAGASIKPNIPYIKLNEKSGEDIRTGKAVENPQNILDKAKILGRTLSKLTPHMVIGESTPAGTTTALGVLTALGYDASFKVSGSMPENPHDLKKDVVKEGMESAGIKWGEKVQDPFLAVEAVGDPMIPAVAGLVLGSDVPVTLAGGTQMTAVCALIKALKPDFDFSKVCIATTIFVAEDETSDINHIVQQIGNIPIYAVDPSFHESENEGLKTYLNGSVKEGVGAGGAMLAAMIQGITIDDIRHKTEELCKEIL